MLSVIHVFAASHLAGNCYSTLCNNAVMVIDPNSCFASVVGDIFLFELWGVF